MPKLAALIAAAGMGSRSGLKFPKTLFLIKNRSILSRIFNAIHKFDSKPTIIASPYGHSLIKEHIDSLNLNAYFAIQQSPKGMGDAVLQMRSSQAYFKAGHILLIWGDIPFLQQETLNKLIDYHFEHNNDFTFPTLQTESAYTIVQRDKHHQVKKVIETRENLNFKVESGERDIGVFLFKKDLIFNILNEDLSNKYSQATKEHGFLYIIEHLVDRGYKVEALSCATALDSVSLNSIKDVSEYL